jgi:hypothetical protein
MRPRAPLILATAVLIGAVLACGPAGTPAPSAADRATGLAQTAAAVLTSTALAVFTPPSPTPLPTTTSPAPTATDTPAAPTDTATPAASPTPCVDDSEFVADVNVPDGTHFAAGASFVKTWRLRNDGTCTWTPAYTFRSVGGNAMGGATVTVPNDVPPGGTLDISVSLTAPGGNGRHTGQWQLFNPGGTAFGTKPFVEINVP